MFQSSGSTRDRTIGRTRMAESATASGKVYGIVQMPTALEAIQHASAAAQEPLFTAIFKLQTNPRPDEREPADDYLVGGSSIIVRTTNPHYRITYQIDDTAYRVVIIAVSEARWMQ